MCCSPLAVTVGGTVATVTGAGAVGAVGAVTVAAVRDGDGGDVVGGLGAGLGVGGSGLAVRVGLTGVVTIVVLSPLVVVSPDLASVLLIIVGLGGDGVVRLAPSGVGVGAVSLLGPLVVVVAAVLGTPCLGGIAVVLSSVSLATVGSLAAV